MFVCISLTFTKGHDCAESHFHSGWVWALQCSPTSDVPVMSSPQLCHCGHRSLSWNVVSLDVQQQCSWLYQKPTRQIPSFMSVSQWAAMSMPPARAPGRGKDEFGTKRTRNIYGEHVFTPSEHCRSLFYLPSVTTWELPLSSAKQATERQEERYMHCCFVFKKPFKYIKLLEITILTYN